MYLLEGYGAQTGVCAGCPHFALCVTFVKHDVTFFSQDIFSKQIVMGPTLDTKIELHGVISAA